VEAANDKTGVLLLNLGTPDAPRTPEVRRYLKQFLSDPDVIDINPLGRWLLVNLVIAPFRSPKSADAYKKVWMSEGSPLLVHGRALVEEVQQRLPETPVELAMRYGNPSVRSGLEALRERGCERIVAFPLYPQYATSSTASSEKEVEACAREIFGSSPVEFVPPFYDHPGFVKAMTASARPVLDELRPDHVLLSFHGLPQRHCSQLDDNVRHCFQSDSCCDVVDDRNPRCYRAQCAATARAVSSELGLDPDGWTMSFQSRLGREPWIKPYTDLVIPELAQKGVRRLAVLCPAFVADCLETLEEIGIRASDDFRAAGGERLELVPSLNATNPWVDAVVELIERAKRRRSLPVAG
jgi:ferrochelatase